MRIGTASPISSTRLQRLPTLKPAADANYASNVLLIQPRDTDANGSTTITDYASGGKTITCQGNAQISRAASRWGLTSITFDGSGDYLSLADSGDWDFGSGDFHIGAWLLFSAAGGGEQAIWSQWTGSSGTKACLWTLNRSTGAHKLYWTTNGTTNQSVSVAGTVLSGVWGWYEVRRASGVVQFGLDGVQQGTDQAVAATFFNPTTQLEIGVNASTSFPLQGFIGELRATKGNARSLSRPYAPLATS